MAKRRKRYRIKKSGVLFLAAILIALAAIVFLLVRFVILPMLSSAGDDPSDSSSSSESTSQISALDGDHLIEVAQEQIKQGDLILVNRNNSFDFDLNVPNLISIYDFKTSSYKVKDTNVSVATHLQESMNQMLDAFYANTNITDLVIISGHRTSAVQQALFQQEVEQQGNEEVAATWVARPGTSEHHTGLAIDFGIFRTDGTGDNFTGEGDYGWINENCHKYGFILRYEESKSELTGISYEPWHFRYIGKAHAAKVVELGYCYEEYMEYIKAFTYEKQLTITDVDGQNYTAYYVPAESSGNTMVPVPQDGNYSISGNNVDGFIVTVPQAS